MLGTTGSRAVAQAIVAVGSMRVVAQIAVLVVGSIPVVMTNLGAAGPWPDEGVCD
jgi:hypothetical protein